MIDLTSTRTAPDKVADTRANYLTLASYRAIIPWVYRWLGTSRLFDLAEWFFRVVRLKRPAPTGSALEFSAMCRIWREISLGRNSLHQTRYPQKSKDRLATHRLAKVRWERNEEVEGIATVAAGPQIQVSLLQKCTCEGTAFRPLVSAHPAWDSQLVLPSLL